MYISLHIWCFILIMGHCKYLFSLDCYVCGNVQWIPASQLLCLLNAFVVQQAEGLLCCQTSCRFASIALPLLCVTASLNGITVHEFYFCADKWDPYRRIVCLENPISQSSLEIFKANLFLRWNFWWPEQVKIYKVRNNGILISLLGVVIGFFPYFALFEEQIKLMNWGITVMDFKETTW